MAKNWFWAVLCLRIVKKKEAKNPKARVDVWKNLVLITADTPVEAIKKANTLGKFEAKVSSTGLTWDDQPAVFQFLGLESIGLVHEPLQDGVEITWTSTLTTLANSEKFVTDGKTLKAELAKEFSPRAIVRTSKAKPSKKKAKK